MNDACSRGFDAVAIGASAGGVSALQHILSVLPATFPLPIVVVLHLPRTRPSRLAEVLQPYCRVLMCEAEDKQPLEPGHVYIAPPDYHLLVEDRHTLALSVDPPVLFSRPAIDVMFESAAEVFADRLLAILLTGASADGAAGMAAVRTGGGMAWVQDPDEAVSSIMPAAALAHAGADAVLKLDEIRNRIEGITK